MIGKVVDFVVAPFNKEMRGPSMDVARRVRDSGHVADLILEPRRKVAQSFEYADRVGAQYIIFVAPDEISKGFVRIKDLRETNNDLKEYDIPLHELKTVEKFLSNERERRIATITE